MSDLNSTIVVRDPDDLIIKAVKDSGDSTGKPRLHLDVDGTLVAMEFDPTYMSTPEGD
jgi:hypothetical protein